MRVVSLVPSLTETLLAWGVVPVACTRFCEQPTIRSVGGTKNPDLAAIASLSPDLVVMDQEENRKEDYQALRAQGIPVHALAVRSLADLDAEMAELARRLGVPWEPAPALEGGHDPRGPAVPVFVPIWRRPWMALGTPTYGASLLAALGLSTVYSEPGSPYPEVSLDDAAGRHPAAVLAPSEPYPFSERHRAELETVAPVVFVDGKDLFWWGDRTRAALGRIREATASLVP